MAKRRPKGVKHTGHWMSRKQSGYLMGLERRSGHQLLWIQRSDGGMTKGAANSRIRDLLARLGEGDGGQTDIDNDLHSPECSGCVLDRF